MTALPELSITSTRYLRALEAYATLAADADAPAHQRARAAINEASADRSWMPAAKALNTRAGAVAAVLRGLRKIVKRDAKGLVQEVIEIAATASDIQEALGTR